MRLSGEMVKSLPWFALLSAALVAIWAIWFALSLRWMKRKGLRGFEGFYISALPCAVIISAVGIQSALILPAPWLFLAGVHGLGIYFAFLAGQSWEFRQNKRKKSDAGSSHSGK